MANVNIRFIEQSDLEEVVQCEKASKLYQDEDFDVEMVKSWAWSEGDFLDAIRVNRNKLTGELETRMLVAEIPVTGNVLDDDGVEHQEMTIDWICGSFIFQPVKQGYDIWYFNAHKAAPPEVRERMLEWIITKAYSSDTRKHLRIVLHDGDDVNLKFFQDQKWTIKLVRDHFTEKPSDELGNQVARKSDGWECTWAVEREKQGNGEGLVTA